MTINEIKDFLAGKPGYLKKSADVLSERLNCPIEDCETALYEARKLARNEENTNDNDNVISRAETRERVPLEMRPLPCRI